MAYWWRRFIQGTDITIPVDADYERAAALFVSYCSKAKQVKLKGFQAFEGRPLTPQQEARALALAREIVEKTGVVGLCRIDMMMDEAGRFFVLECNSVTVTGLYSSQAAFSEHFVHAENARHNVNLSAILVANAFRVFAQKDQRAESAY